DRSPVLQRRFEQNVHTDPAFDRAVQRGHDRGRVIEDVGDQEKIEMCGVDDFQQDLFGPARWNEVGAWAGPDKFEAASVGGDNTECSCSSERSSDLRWRDLTPSDPTRTEPRDVVRIDIWS